MPKFESWGVTLLVVTGASRGFGSTICEDLSRSLSPGSIIVGLARSTSGLEETKVKVADANSNVKYFSKSIDVGKATNREFQQIFDDIPLSQESFDRVILVHNAGTTGDLGFIKNIGTSESIKEFYDVNVSSVVPLTALFISFVKSQCPKAQIHVINVTSLMAIQAFKTFGLYCSAKAARDMLFNVLALEEPEMDVLSYSPGPLDNEMQDLVQNSTTADPEIVHMFASMKSEGKLIRMSSSVAKLMGVLEGGKYKSGDHVDFYDEI